MAITPEWDVKLATSKHVWEGAQHAERLGRRLVELRARAWHPRAGRRCATWSRPPTARPTRSIGWSRSTGWSALPGDGLRRAGQRTSAVADAPTVDLLADLSPRVERQIRWGESWIGELATDRERRERAIRWQLELERHVGAIRDALAGRHDRADRRRPDAAESALDRGSPLRAPGQERRPGRAVRPLMNVRPEEPDPDPERELFSRMHRMSQSELGAAELLGRVMYEHPNMPFEFHYDMARQTWDEVRHEVAWKRLEDIGGHLGMLPERPGGNFERRMSMDLPHLLAILRASRGGGRQRSLQGVHPGGPGQGRLRDGAATTTSWPTRRLTSAPDALAVLAGEPRRRHATALDRGGQGCRTRGTSGCVSRPTSTTARFWPASTSTSIARRWRPRPRQWSSAPRRLAIAAEPHPGHSPNRRRDPGPRRPRPLEVMR